LVTDAGVAGQQRAGSTSALRALFAGQQRGDIWGLLVHAARLHVSLFAFAHRHAHAFGLSSLLRSKRFLLALAGGFGLISGRSSGGKSGTRKDDG
jgi:hypothetical protein